MSPQESRLLWCILECDPKLPYDVFDIPLGANIFQVKEKIKQKIEDLNDINIDRLKLRKFNKTIPVNPDSSLAEHLEALGDITMYSQELSSEEIVGELFPEPHSQKHLHILVQILPSASRKHLLGEEDDKEAKRQKIDSLSVSDTDGDLAWLMALHSKIWKGGDGCLKTFVHRVEVTVAHYRELQRRLKTRPNQDSDEDIPAIKRKILLYYNPTHNTLGNEENVSEESDDDGPELVPNSDSSDNEQVPANVNEESGDDDLELASFLPATFEFLDLSSLGFEYKPSRLPLPLFVRPEYNLILDKIRGRKMVNFYNSKMISGQPGTGKTAFLHYMMIKYMLDGIPFLYQSFHGIVYYVSEKVKIIESWDHSKNIVAFVDADGTESNQRIPRGFLHHRCMQFILAPSPKGASPKWATQLDGIIPEIVELWTEQEFFVTGIFLHPYHLDFARLRESASYFGFNPQRCFQASRSQKMFDSCRSEVIEKICSIDPSISLFTLMKGASGKQPHEISHIVFELFPLNENRLLIQAQVRTVSLWALSQLLEEYNRRQANAAVDFYTMIARLPSAEPLRGDMFRLHVLKYLNAIDQPKTFKIRNLATHENLNWYYPGPAPRCDFEKRNLTAVLEEIVQQKQPRHLIPLATNYVAVDSILYKPASVLTSLQVTITNEHPIAVSDLKIIQQSLKHNTPLEDLWPGALKEKRWHLIFVVPQEDADSFGLQKFTGDTVNDSWAQKVDQYVLGLNVDTVFAN